MLYPATWLTVGVARRMFTPEVGGVLNRTVHLYAYADMNERERTRKGMLQRAQWTDFLSRARPYVIGPQVRPRPLPPARPCPALIGLNLHCSSLLLCGADGRALVLPLPLPGGTDGFQLCCAVLRALQATKYALLPAASGAQEQSHCGGWGAMPMHEHSYGRTR